jgi:beta-lactamase class A
MRVALSGVRRHRGPAAYIVLAVLAAILTGAALALRSPGPGSEVPAARPAPTASPALDPFVRVSAGKPGTLLAAVYDIATGREWNLGTGAPQAEASIVKLDILQTLLARDRLLPAADLPVARQMMEDSNNDAATSLWYASGGPGGIGAYNAAAGLRGTKLSTCVECTGFDWPGWGLTTTTPADQIALLRQLISPRSLLSASERRYMLSLMENVVPGQRWGVSGGVPSGVTVALKNGWLPLDAADHDWQINSVGWIDGDGRDYLVAVLTTGNATEQDGITRINQLSSLLWANMAKVFR